jgi:hypothetical protein
MPILYQDGFGLGDLPYLSVCNARCPFEGILIPKI